MFVRIAIDILNGKCVRLLQGNYEQSTEYASNPIEMAMKIADNGFNYLHIVDLDGAREKKVMNAPIVQKIIQQTKLKVDFGGGLKTIDQVKTMVDIGVEQFTLGSAAIQNPNLVDHCLQEFGNNMLIIGADFLNGTIAISGWKEKTSITLESFIEQQIKKGVKKFICTDISKDGMLLGPSADVYAQLLEKFSIDLVASGGVHSVNDLETLSSIGCESAIVGKAFYENKIEIKSLLPYA